MTLGFSTGTNAWRPYLAPLDDGAHGGMDFLLAWISKESGGNPCSYPSSTGESGIWQLMPDTAREAGLHITADYDGRLDIHASTNAALDLLQRYDQEFGDWRLADMAFNAGEYGIKDLVGDARTQRSAAELGRLRVQAQEIAKSVEGLAVSIRTRAASCTPTPVPPLFAERDALTVGAATSRSPALSPKRTIRPTTTPAPRFGW